VIKTQKGEVLGTRVYVFNDLRGAGVPYTRKHVRTLELRGEFPQHFDIGPNSVGWVAAEVDGWVESKIRSRGTRAAA
jgi:hypothetical protein